MLSIEAKQIGVNLAIILRLYFDYRQPRQKISKNIHMLTFEFPNILKNRRLTGIYFKLNVGSNACAVWTSCMDH